jgi:predicted acyltransferase
MTPEPAVRVTSPRQIRVESIDVFRGLTIALMIFVIAVAAGNYPDLPHQASWFGSLPVSTWNHAEVGWDKFVEEKSAAGWSAEQIQALPEASLRNIGLTVTDLVAPFFVFVVGLVIPLSKAHRGGHWWRHVFSRTAKLILAGVVYISLILGISWWWGILQAIGIAYLMAALSLKLTPRLRWVVLFAVLALHQLMSQYVPWWLQFGHTQEPFWRISQPDGNWARPLTIHCLPWVSISYGAIAMIGVLLGEVVASGRRSLIISKSLLYAALFMALGYGLHRIGFITAQMKWCFNKPDVSASYSLFTSGLAALLFGVLYMLIDGLGVKKWSWPLAEFGKNALLAYFLQIVMRIFFRSLHVEYFFNAAVSEATTAWARLLGQPWSGWLLDKSGYHGVGWGIVWVLCLWTIVHFLNKKNIYWKL